MADLFAQVRAVFADHIERFRNRDFFEATMAAAAFVSMADGTVNLTEANIVDQALEAVHELKIYDPHDAVDLYHDYIEKLQTDPDDAQDNIFETVSKIAGDDQAAHVLIKICVAIGESDGDFISEEKLAVRRIAVCLGLDPAEIEM
jgi:tellurite resistance protein TerB